MKNDFKIYIMVLALILGVVQFATAQDLQREVVRGMLSVIGPEVIKDVLKSSLADLISDPNLKKRNC